MRRIGFGLLFIVGCGSTTGTPSDARSRDGGGLDVSQVDAPLEVSPADAPLEISPTDAPLEISPADVGDGTVDPSPDAAFGNDADTGTRSDGGVEQAPGTVCGSMVDITPLDGAVASAAERVNEAGQVVGYACSGPNDFYCATSFVWAGGA